MLILLEGNPFVDAYVDSDFLGKIIFVGLILLSIVTWSVLAHKLWIVNKVKKDSLAFRKVFLEKRETPLEIEYNCQKNPECPNAFFIIYEIIKNNTLEILDKNQKVTGHQNSHHERQQKKILHPHAYLSSADIELIDSSSINAVTSLSKYLDKNLYILSTIVTLAPFLGLLGTVYGILTTFSGMKSDPLAASNQVVLGGLSLALTTTVIGLVDAIPALIGYNYLKNLNHDFDAEMNRFANDVLLCIELNYRKVE